jgi:hypothetical protein
LTYADLVQLADVLAQERRIDAGAAVAAQAAVAAADVDSGRITRGLRTLAGHRGQADVDRFLALV